MPTNRRWKRLFLLGAATTTLAVIVWAAYLFTAIWLRVRCARELAGQAESLPEVAVSDQIQSGESEGTNRWFAMVDFDARRHSALERLESLQQPNVATVLRYLLGRGQDEPNARIQQMHSLVFVSDGKALASSGSNTTTVRLWNAQTGAPQTGSFSLNVTAAPSAVNVGQILAVWEPDSEFQCFSVTDSHGEKVLVVTRPLLQEAGDEQTIESSPPPRELLLIDTAGRIFARRPCPGGGLVGKLPEPHGKADQLVFGTRTYVNDQNGTLVLRIAGPGVVCIVEDGELKTVRSIPAPISPANQAETAAPAENE